MSETDFGGARGATCPLHPERLASRTCTRCGNFMCDTCSEEGTQTQCPNCRAREGVGRRFPLDRHNWSIVGLVESCWEGFKREWVLLSVGAFLFFAASIMGSLISQLLSFIGGASGSTVFMGLMVIVGTLGSWVVQGIATLGLLRICLDVLNGQRADMGRFFSQLNKLLPYLLTLLLSILLMLPVVILCLGGALVTLIAMSDFALSELFTSDVLMEALTGASPQTYLAMGAVGFLLYLGPGLWLTMPLVLMQPALVATDNPSPVETLRRCFTYAKGQRLPMFGVMAIGVCFLLIGVMLCCLPGLPAMAFFQLMLAGLYLSLSRGAEEEV